MNAEFLQDAYQQAERLMLVRKAASADSDDHVNVVSGTLAKLSPPTKRKGRHLVLFIVLVVRYPVVNVLSLI